MISNTLVLPPYPNQITNCQLPPTPKREPSNKIHIRPKSLDNHSINHSKKTMFLYCQIITPNGRNHRTINNFLYVGREDGETFPIKYETEDKEFPKKERPTRQLP